MTWNSRAPRCVAGRRFRGWPRRLAYPSPALAFRRLIRPSRCPGGVMIGGFDSPVAVGIDDSFVHPPELAAGDHRPVSDATFLPTFQRPIRGRPAGISTRIAQP